MNPGLFNKRITFQLFNPDAKDSDGFPLPDDQKWTDFKTVWAMVKTLQGREYFAAAAVQAENTVRFIVRYIKGLDTSMRISYNSRTFSIESIINDDEANKTLTIIAKEVVPSD